MLLLFFPRHIRHHPFVSFSFYGCLDCPRTLAAIKSLQSIKLITLEKSLFHKTLRENLNEINAVYVPFYFRLQFNNPAVTVFVPAQASQSLFTRPQVETLCEQHHNLFSHSARIPVGTAL